jgi:hypothetical protein
MPTGGVGRRIGPPLQPRPGLTDQDLELADGLAAISLSPFISLINYVHSAHGLPHPNGNRADRQVRDGLRRTYGVAPLRQAHPSRWPSSAHS